MATEESQVSPPDRRAAAKRRIVGLLGGIWPFNLLLSLADEHLISEGIGILAPRMTVLFDDSLARLEDNLNSFSAKLPLPTPFDLQSLSIKAKRAWSIYVMGCEAGAPGFNASDPIPLRLIELIARTQSSIINVVPTDDNDKIRAECQNAIRMIKSEMDEFPDKWIIPESVSAPKPPTP